MPAGSYLFLSRVVALALGIIVTSTPTARAASANWNASPTDGVWDVTSQNNWSTGAGTFPGTTSGTTNADTATFKSSTTTAISINSTTFNIKSILFGSSGTALDPFTIGSTGGNSLFVTSGGTVTFQANTTPTNTTETINAPIVLNGNYTFNNANADASNVLLFGGGITAAVTSTLSLTGPNTGANTITGNISNGAGVLGVTVANGKWILSGANSYTGVTRVTGGTLQIAKQVSLYNNNTANWTAANIVVSNATTLALNVGGTGEFTSANIDILKSLGTNSSNGFRPGGILGLDTTNASGGVFTYNSNIDNPSYSGSNLGLTKLGTNTLALSGTNSYTGATLVNAGTLVVSGGGLTGTTAITVSGGSLQIGASNVLNDTATMTLSGGTLNAQTFAETVGTLTLSGNSFISLAGGTLAFADSSGATWGSFTIDITGFVSGSSLRFGINASGLSSGQLSKFTASGFSSFGLNSSGYLTAVPEPATWGLLALSLTTVLVMRRRRRA